MTLLRITLLAIGLLVQASYAFTLFQGFKHDISRRLEKLSCEAPVDGVRLSFHEGGAPSDHRGLVGDRVELVCEVFGAPQATVFWTFNGQPIASSPVVGADEEHLLNAGRQLIGSSTTKSVLVIDCLDRSTAGDYGCHADNKCTKPIAAHAIVSIEIQQETKALHTCKKPSENALPRFTMWTDLRLERPEAAVQLFCRAKGNPPADITWFLAADEEDDPDKLIQNDETHVLLNNGDLIVRGVPEKDAVSTGGTIYKCTAKNILGEISTEVVLVRSAL